MESRFHIFILSEAKDPGSWFRSSTAHEQLPGSFASFTMARFPVASHIPAVEEKQLKGVIYN